MSQNAAMTDGDSERRIPINIPFALLVPGLFFEAFNLFNTGNFGNSFDGTTGSPNFKKPINFFGATGFSEPIGIPFQGQFGVRFSF